MGNVVDSAIPENVIPSITIDASNVFAATIVRLLADLTINLSSDEDAGEKFLDLSQLSVEIEKWREENLTKCVS